jgi:hypothetical protein
MIFMRIQSLFKEIDQVSFWHVKRELNSFPYEMENNGENGVFGLLTINGKTNYNLVP